MAWEVNTDSPIYKSLSPDQQAQVNQMAQSGNIPPSIDQLYSSLQQTKTSTAATAAEIPGIQASSGIKQIQQQQILTPSNLSKDLIANKMTLPDALKTYTANGAMTPDNVFRQYLAESPWGLPNESPSELRAKGISADAIGKIGDNGSFADKWNTKQAVLGIRDLQNKWNTVSGLSKIGAFGIALATPSSQGYDSQRGPVAAHISSLIPGAPGGQATAEQLANGIPDIGHITQMEPGAAEQKFIGTEKGLMNVKGYNYEDLGLTQPKQQQQQIQQSSGKELLNGLLQFALPTAGGIGGGLGGGLIGGIADIPTGVIPGAAAGAIGGAAAGGAGGQALADVLTGKKIGADVPITGVLSGAGEGVGAGLGAILGKAGGALSNKVGSNVFDKVVSASPNYVDDVGALKATASKYGLMDGSSAEGLAQMPKIMSDIGSKIKTSLDQVKTPVNLADVTKSILDDFNKQTNAFENTADFENAQKYITKRLYTGTGNDNPLSEILNPAGQPANKANAQTTYSALYDLKSQVAKDLKPVFKAQANPALTTNFTPKQEANLALWNGLKNEIDKADPNIRVLNDDQHNMFDVAKGFVKDAVKSKGGGNAMTDIFDILAGNMAGGPLGALALYSGRKAVASEVGRNAISKLLQGNAITKGIPAIGGGLGAGLGAILGQ